MMVPGMGRLQAGRWIMAQAMVGTGHEQVGVGDSAGYRQVGG